MSKQLDDYIGVKGLIERVQEIDFNRLHREYANEILREIRNAVNGYERKYNTIFDLNEYQELENGK